jgi:hypothetical protein
MPKEDIFNEYAKIAVETGLVKVAKEDSSISKKSKNTRLDYSSSEAIQALYGIKPDGNESANYEKNIAEYAHPNSVVISPAHDKINGLVENINERQNIMLNIVNDPTNGHLNQRKYAKSELVQALVRVANDMDNKDEEELRILADFCIENTIKKSADDNPLDQPGANRAWQRIKELWEKSPELGFKGLISGGVGAGTSFLVKPLQKFFENRDILNKKFVKIFKKLSADDRKRYFKNKASMFRGVAAIIAAATTWTVLSYTIDKDVEEKIELALAKFEKYKRILGENDPSIVVFSALNLQKLLSVYKVYVAGGSREEYKSEVKIYQTEWDKIKERENTTNHYSNSVGDLYDACKELSMSLPRQLASIDAGVVHKEKIEEATATVKKEAENLSGNENNQLINGF